MKPAHTLAAVLASAWFLPVSCTGMMGAGAALLAETDARDAARGEFVHRSIAVVAQPPRAPGQPFTWLLLGRVPEHKEQYADATFLMPAPAGTFAADGTTVSYRVTGGSADEQTIETDYRDGDRSAWGRYRATKRDVVPLASHLSAMDYIPMVVLPSFIVAVVLLVAGRIVRRRQLNDGAR